LTLDFGVDFKVQLLDDIEWMDWSVVGLSKEKVSASLAG